MSILAPLLPPLIVKDAKTSCEGCQAAENLPGNAISSTKRGLSPFCGMELLSQ
jgi:hypothetical protein